MNMSESEEIVNIPTEFPSNINVSRMSIETECSKLQIPINDMRIMGMDNKLVCTPCLSFSNTPLSFYGDTSPLPWMN